jgi:ABC-2 type transport system permease protein
LILAFLVRFLVEWTLAQAAFWTTRVSAINQVYFVLLLFLSGQIAPISLFPHPVQVIAYILPFRWMIGFPVELLLGRLTPLQALTGIGAQIVWLVLSLVLVRLAWRAGIRIYSAVGA